MGAVAEVALAELDELVVEMDADEIARNPAMGADAAFLADMSASNRANAARVLTTFARREAPTAVDIPPEALDVARTVARRGFDLNAIFQSYRRGQNIVWRRYMMHAIRLSPSGPVLGQLLEAASERMFEYVDGVIGKVIAAAQREREELLGGVLARRTETVRLILDGAPIDSHRASERLGYALSRRHTALVVWTSSAAAQGVLESTATLLARSVGARQPLTVSAGASTLWAWLGTDSDPDTAAFHAAVAAAPAEVRVAVGPTAPGIAGFRRSHAAALDLQGLLAGYPDGGRLALHRDLEVTVLAAQDHGRAVDFVASTLGPLATDTPAAARLRETLRVFLDEAENAPRAAARLHTHRNTVLQRVARAATLLGYRPGEHRLAVELALELAHQLSPRVLSPRARHD
ncbi:PucR family transcriptional regulator [Nocardia sp. CT2-14]|uniref:PucR family transcriptional regulator n=2 Tax=Nocardia aurantiaca TaxID=2675850 RepID=A0A6I3KRV1_9NOCA|nr:PucR family transcriptional regulator [Nocardia aurantiaca]